VTAKQGADGAPESGWELRARDDRQVNAVGGRSTLSWPAEALVLDALAAAVIVSDPAGVVLYANLAAERMYGHPRSALLGSDLRELLVADADQALADDIMRQVLGGASWSGEFTVPHADGGAATVRITDSPVYRDGAVVAVVGVAEDVSAAAASRHDAERVGARLAQLTTVIAALAAAADVETVVTTVVEQAAAAVGATVSSVSLLDDDQTLRLVRIKGAPVEAGRRWASYRITDQTPASEAARTGRTVVVADRADLERRYPGLVDPVSQERAIVCLPLTAGDRRLGVISLSFPGPRVPDEPELAFLHALADVCAAALDRLAALDEARAAGDKLAFLAEASVELAGSRDLDQTLNNIARLVVPRLAEWCVVHVAEDGALRPVAVAHADPAKVIWARGLEDRYPVDPAAPTGVPRVIATGESELYPDITDEMLVAAARDEQHLRVLRQLGMRSVLIVPLTGRTGTFGALTLIGGEQGRRFTEDDQRLAEDLGRRAALAVENADAFREQSGRLAAVSRVAEAAQRAILAPVPSGIGPVRLAARYVSAAAEARVGGDLYEVVRRPSAVRLIVGDVRGKGLEAVRTATIVLGEFRAAATDLDDLPAVAVQIDRRLAPYLGDEDFVTAVLAEIDDDGGLTLATCGHPPAVVARADGRTEELGEPGSLPLGLGARPTPVTTNLAVGDRVLLYTDGILEARDPAGRFVELPEVLAGLSKGTPDQALGQVLVALNRAIDHALNDDLALLLAEFAPERPADASDR
jgi:PAS domain S-box-containing protein